MEWSAFEKKHNNYKNKNNGDSIKRKEQIGK